MRVLSIDVGIRNLALARIQVLPSFCVEAVKLIDVTNIEHDKVPEHECTLRHSSELSDRLDHVCQENETEFFKGNDVVLVERQPIPQGLTDCQLYFYNRFKQTQLIHPRSVHAHFGLPPKKYEERKELSTLIALQIIRENKPVDSVLRYIEDLERKHDIGDAIVQAYYWAGVHGMLPIDRFEDDRSVIWYRPSRTAAREKAQALARRAMGEELPIREAHRADIMCSLDELDKFRYVPHERKPLE